MRLIRILLNSSKFSKETVPGLASMVISASLVKEKFSRIDLNMASNCFGVSREGVPPPKKMV